MQLRTRSLLAFLILLTSLSASVSVSKASTPWSADDVQEAMSQASPRAQCVVTQEIGGRSFDPYSVGAQGELGPLQLHPRGLLPDFYAKGGRDVFSPYESIAYFEAMDRQGLAALHWPTLASC